MSSRINASLCLAAVMLLSPLAASAAEPAAADTPAAAAPYKPMHKHKQKHSKDSMKECTAGQTTDCIPTPPPPPPRPPVPTAPKAQ